MILTPAYGRDYTSRKALLADFAEGKDFVIADLFHPDSGRYVNREQIIGQRVEFRYKKNRSCFCTVVK